MRPPCRPIDRARRGTAYLLALGLSMLLTVIAAGTLYATRAAGAAERDRDAAAAASAAAVAGTAWGMQLLETAAPFAGGTVTATRSVSGTLDGASVDVTIAAGTDPLAADELAPAVITSVARVDQAVRRIESRAVFAPMPIDSFRNAVTVRGTVELASNTRLQMTDGKGVVGSIVLGSGAAVTGTLLQLGAAPTDDWGSVAMAIRSPVLPNAANLSALVGEGSSSPFWSGGAGSRWMLAPTLPLSGGAANQRGVFVVDCANQTLDLTQFRLVGTLVLLDPAPDSRLRGPFVLEPAVKGYPSLVVRGSINIEFDGTLLDETAAKINFNPQGAPHPYLGGASDDDRTDTYTSSIGGYVVCTGDLTITGSCLAGGVIVGGDLAIDGGLAVTRDQWASWAPASAFQSHRWREVPGSRREVFSDP